MQPTTRGHFCFVFVSLQGDKWPTGHCWLQISRQINLACGKSTNSTPFFKKWYPSTATTNHEFRCSTNTPMAPFLMLQRDPAQVAPDASRRSSWHRWIVAVFLSSSKLSGWGVSTHPASDYSWIPPSSVESDYYPHPPTTHPFSLLWSHAPVNLHFGERKKQQHKKGNHFILGILFFSHSSLFLFRLCALLS